MSLFDYLLVHQHIYQYTNEQVDDMPLETLGLWIGFGMELEKQKWSIGEGGRPIPGIAAYNKKFM